MKTRSIVNMVFAAALVVGAAITAVWYDRANARGDAPSFGYEGILYVLCWIVLGLMFLVGVAMIYKNKNKSNHFGLGMIVTSIIGACIVLEKWSDVSFGNLGSTIVGLVGAIVILAAAFVIPNIGRK